MNKKNFFSILLLFALSFISCKKNDINNIATKPNSTVLKSKITNDTIINNININKLNDIGNINKEKIIQLYFNCFKKDGIEPNIMLEQVKADHSKITVKKYIALNIQGNIYPTYFISFPYENDETYKCLILSNENIDEGLIIYEKVIDEGEYLRFSKINKNTIKNLLYNIEYYNYDNDGNIISNKKTKDSTILKENTFEINNNKFERKIKSELIFKVWKGKYTFTVNEKSPDWRAMQDVTLTIKNDSVIFHVEGYQIAQDYSLKIMEADNKRMKLFYNSSIGGDESAVLQKTKDFGIISFDGKKYTWSCPYIDESFTDGKKNVYTLKKKK